MEYELMHYGIKGMKWGVRKKRAVIDGLTRRAVVGPGVPSSYGWGSKHQLSRAKKDLRILDDGGHLSIGITKKRQAAFDARDRSKLEKKISNLEAKEKAKAEKKEYNNSPEGKAERAEKLKKAAKVGAAVAGTTLAVYGAKKLHDYVRTENGKLAEEAGRKAIEEASKWTSVTGLESLASFNKQSGNYARAFDLENKASKIVADHAFNVQNNMENLKFAKAAANVYLNKRR